VCALLLSGCAALRVPWLPGQSDRLTQEELRDELGDFANHFRLLVTQAADTIQTSARNPAVRRRALLWKLQIIPLVEEAALEPNPQEAFVSVLTLVVTMRQYLVEGDGRATLGEHQELAAGVARDLEKELRRIGTQFLGEAEMERVGAEVEAFVKSNPVGGQEFAIQSVRRTLANVESTSVFRSVVAVPLAPFRALEGVGDSATAIRSFNATAREFVRAVGRLPDEVRWQVELLLYEIEERDSVKSALASLQSLSTSADRFSTSTERLPEDARSLLQDTGKTLTQLQQVVASARELAGPLRETSEQLQQASAAWATILGPREGEEQKPPGRPFDIREWQSAVREVGDTSQQLQRLLQEMRATSEATNAALVPLSTALDRVDRVTRSWIDLAAWRLAQLLVVGLALGLVYRLAARSIARR
jgi:hypothetical protein